MHTVAEVLAAINHHAGALPPRAVPLEHALGLQLGEDIRMDIDAPPFDRAMLDGFAARAVDALAGAQLRIIGRIDAGSEGSGHPVGQGECVGINTGAPVPPGTDVVIPVEHTAAVGGHAGYVQIIKAGARGGGVQMRGSDSRAGECVLPKGRLLSPTELAVAASAGKSRLVVADPKPVVALLVTGDELVPVEALPGPAQIRNTNYPLLRSLLASHDVPFIDLGTQRDDEGVLRAAIDRGLAQADVLLVTGGMSMGTKDLIPRLLVEAGVAIHTEKVRIKPGKPFVFGTATAGGAKKFVAGLPGNPVSAYVCFVRFVVPLLRALDPDLPGPRRATEQAYVDSDLPAAGDREFYQPCSITNKGSPIVVTPLPWRGSADLFTLARADALIVHPAGAPACPAQSLVDILHLRT